MQPILRSKTLFAAALLSTVVGSSVAAAADRVTLVLRSGEKITGDLDGQTENRIYVRTTHADQPKVPIDQIAMIDVGGDAINPSAEEVAQAAGSAHYLIPQNGAPFKGQFIRLEGSPTDAEPKPVVIVFKKESGEESRIPVSATRRMYFGNYTPPATAPTSTSTSPAATPLGAGERAIMVAANADWVDTGMTVAQGTVVTFSASGEVTLSGDANDKAIPTGSTSGRMAPGSPLPASSVGTLIARVGAARGRSTNAPMAIGNQMTVTMPAAGRLFLRVNDDQVADNTGQYEVRIKMGSGGSN